MRSMFKSIGIVFRHELQDFLRDKSTLKSMLILLCFMPILFSYIIGNVEGLVKGVREKDKRVGYIESEAVSRIIPFLQQQGMEAVKVSGKSKEIFKEHKLDVLLSERERDELDSPDAHSVSIELWTSGTNDKVLAGARQIAGLIKSYSLSVGKRQLILRGVAPVLIEPIELEMKTISADDSAGFAALDLLVSIFGMALFYSTLHLAVDATAGERERQTLESLFYTAAPRSAFVFGKWLVVTSMIFLAVWLVGTIFWALGEYSIFQRLLGRTETFAYSKVLYGLLLFFPLFPMVAAMQIMIGSLCSSVKQAQAFNGISGILSLPLSFLLFVEQVKQLAWVPIFGQGLAYRSLLHGEDFDWQALLVTEAITLG
ncbi:MAG: ABC transporter permease, partial [Proteobacteria bacterium]